MNEENILYLVGDKDINKNIILNSLGINNNNNNNIYKINTKYYESDISIKSLDLDKDNSSNKHSINTNGIILAFDSSKSESFEFIKSYIKNNKVEAYQDDENNDEDGDDQDDDGGGVNDDTLYILVDINKSSSSSIEDMVEEWCISNLIEFVILDTLSHKEYDIRKSDLTETDPTIKYGIDRINEILESNMWPNMNLKESSTLKRPRKDEQEEFSSIKDNQYLQESLRKVELLFKKPIDEKKEKKSSTDQPKVNNLTIQDPTDEDDDEDDVAIFENAFKELQSLREHMKSLPDDQRRDMAAKVALLFAKNLDMGGGGDDDDDYN